MSYAGIPETRVEIYEKAAKIGRLLELGIGVVAVGAALSGEIVDAMGYTSAILLAELSLANWRDEQKAYHRQVDVKSKAYNQDLIF